MFRQRLNAAVTAVRRGNWRDDFARIGNGLVIAGVATPILSDRGSFISGFVVVSVGIGLTVLAKSQEA